MDLGSDKECWLRVGRTLIALEVAEASLARRLRRHFRVKMRDPAQEAPDIRVRLRMADSEAPGIPDSLFQARNVSDATFTIGGGLVRGTFDRGRCIVDAQVDARLFAGRLIRVFEQLLYQVFFSDPRNRDGNTALLHSSGVIRGGAGFLFTGPSGAGKSTVARLSRGTILNDEICLVTFQGTQTRVGGTPFNGFFKKKQEGSAPLSRVFVLAQAAAHSIEPIGRGAAVSALVQQLVPPVGLDQAVGRDAFERMLDLATEMQRRVPVQRLEFQRDNRFWNAIDELQDDANLQR